MDRAITIEFQLMMLTIVIQLLFLNLTIYDLADKIKKAILEQNKNAQREPWQSQ